MNAQKNRGGDNDIVNKIQSSHTLLSPILNQLKKKRKENSAYPHISIFCVGFLVCCRKEKYADKFTAPSGAIKEEAQAPSCKNCGDRNN